MKFALNNLTKIMFHLFCFISLQRASKFELLCVHRVALLVLAVITALIAFLSPSIYRIFILAADIVFVVMLPQLTSVIYFPFSTSYFHLFQLIFYFPFQHLSLSEAAWSKILKKHRICEVLVYTQSGALHWYLSSLMCIVYTVCILDRSYSCL